MTVLRRLSCILATAWLSSLPLAASALQIAIDQSEPNPLFGQSTYVHLSGELEAGDAARLADALAPLTFASGSALHIVFNSPGGSLLEGMAIGRVIAAQPTTVTTDVEDEQAGPGICASACVLAYLGGHYRYLRDGSRLGVHQFYPNAGTDIGGAEGVALGQVLSAEIVGYLTEMRADPGFFGLMTQASPADITWVPTEELERYRVVTGPVYDQQAEYRNANGIYYLTLWQQSYFGDNKILVTCKGAGKVDFMAFLQPPDQSADDFYNEFTVTIDGEQQQPASFERMDEDGPWAVTAFELAPSQLTALASARIFGAQLAPPSGYVFYGFDFEVTDSKLRDTVAGCLADTREALATPSSPSSGGQMTVFEGRDFLGGDMTSEGIRGVSFEECQAICLDDEDCVAVTWVERSAWCWPKSQLGEYRNTLGLLSALRN